MADDAVTGGWSTIESDEGLFTSLIEQLGVKDVQVEELFSLNADWIRALSPVYGVIFLFKWIGHGSENKEAPRDGTFDRAAAEDEGLFFAAQTIQNACGTQAILSVVLNNDQSVDASSSGGDESGARIDIGPGLRDFKEFTTGFDAGLRGESLSNSEMIRTVHNSFAKSSPFADETIHDPRGGPPDDVFHFIAYTRYHGKLYELDGLQPYPISHGDCTSEEFPDKIMSVLHRRISRYPENEIRFNLMVVCQDQRIKWRELQEPGLLEEEERKREKWDFENALRRHNFVEFTGEVLKRVVKMKVYDGSYDLWVERAKQATEKRVKERLAKHASAS
ncbi:ubiquitin carboxyl-terminal hydrolase L5 [Fonsecaea erecta]|uniref:Ubiquitin carboxyl-terminal hydrolase n=1 Tax=Fonsecaea erecta TaxID=1367422 RepID=A0A178ZZ61_9EURO|nr:ubiquitin carboxyl-terminal hydrolase L5 [Fonsecaea erecta]OAP65012.1 ubiquitin carboxyl-terminal hydrolase L5 [Fonsecaea erecta]